MIALLDEYKEVTRRDVETSLSISQSMAVRLLRGLADKGLIRVMGGGKSTRYGKGEGM